MTFHRYICSKPLTVADAVPPYVSRDGGTANRKVEDTYVVKMSR